MKLRNQYIIVFISVSILAIMFIYPSLMDRLQVQALYHETQADNYYNLLQSILITISVKTTIYMIMLLSMIAAVNLRTHDQNKIKIRKKNLLFLNALFALFVLGVIYSHRLNIDSTLTAYIIGSILILITFVVVTYVMQKPKKEF